eukprot:TRINITY_DN1239_c0_g1_i2.p2 TRINITY_DN1239_c0_g1~~TRINITY_DN1239_c0_g1_i2.p2  ORF type:complete len:341 (-),score=37.68 TRINITY_DN1239_c0_g1_i2:172-1194(-)
MGTWQPSVKDRSLSKTKRHLQQPIRRWSEATGVYESHMWPVCTYNILRTKSATADLMARKLIVETIKQGSDLAMRKDVLKDEPPLKLGLALEPPKETLRLLTPPDRIEIAQSTDNVRLQELLSLQNQENVMEDMRNSIEEYQDPVQVDTWNLISQEETEVQQENQVAMGQEAIKTEMSELQESEVLVVTQYEKVVNSDQNLQDMTGDKQKKRPKPILISDQFLPVSNPKEEEVTEFTFENENREIQAPTTPSSLQPRADIMKNAPITTENITLQESNRKPSSEESEIHEDIQTNDTIKPQEMNFIDLARQRLKQIKQQVDVKRDLRSITRPGPVFQEVAT